MWPCRTHSANRAAAGRSPPTIGNHLIPEPLPVLPLVVLVLLGIFATAFAAYKAGVGALRKEPGGKGRRAGLVIAATAAAISLASIALLANILFTYEGIYEALVWASLNENYGIAPVADQQGYQAGVPFAAILDGENVSCTAVAPESVQCDGETILPFTAP